MVCRIVFQPGSISIDVPEGTSVADAAVKAGVKIKLPCGGKGRCGKCIVNIDGERLLACRTEVRDGMVVEIPEKSSGKVIVATEYRKMDYGEIEPLSDNYGLAVDIGTTTVAVEIINMKDGTSVYKGSSVNLQRDRGEDVLARIQYAEEGGTEELHNLILQTINKIIDDSYVNVAEIKSAYISGNTTMIHLFLDVNPAPIRYPPFNPVVTEMEIKGSQSGLHINPKARVVCMPSVSSYVGGDITSDIVDSGIDVSEKISMLIDVGTNGEVALGNKDILMCCSSSAGPAFEGSQMTSGMLAEDGAIDSVKITDGKVNYTVIGGGKPKGICGSAIIDIISELFKNGYIDKRGNFTEKSGVKDKFEIAKGVVITQSEILSVIMTKAAVYSATRSMVRNLGVTFESLDRIYIAGGFGRFIDLDSAISIGLFPDVDRDKYEYLGNASLSGAKRALMCAKFRKRIDDLFPKMTYLDLSSDPVFYDEYTSAQFLPHTDLSQFPSSKN